jgi:rRNA-processing protein EBP2
VGHVATCIAAFACCLLRKSHGQSAAGASKAGKKRQIRDAKYGFGGRKKLRKQNTAESTADMRARFKGKGQQSKRQLNTKGGVNKRPGKEARRAKRANVSRR